MGVHSYIRDCRLVLPRDQWSAFLTIFQQVVDDRQSIQPLSCAELDRICIGHFVINVPIDRCKALVDRLLAHEGKTRIDYLVRHVGEDIGLNALGIWPPMNMVV